MERINYSGGHIEMGSFHSNLLIFQPIIHTSRLQAGLGDISGKSKPLPKVLCFSWMVTREACLTQENLKRKGFQFCSRCSLCDSNTETKPFGSSLFFHWPTVGTFLYIVRLKWCMPANTCNLLKSWKSIGGIVRQKKCEDWFMLVLYMVDNTEGEEF